MSITLEFTVEQSLNGVRIDTFLSRHLRNYTTFRLQRMIRAGVATSAGGMLDLSSRVFAGQDVAVRLVEPPDKLLEPEVGDLEIVFEDAWMLAINKPAGLVAHPVGVFQTGTLCNFVQAHLDEQTLVKGLLRPGIVHRLDRMTSGIILLAKDHATHTHLSVQFQRGQIRKTYIAVLEGEMFEDAGQINLPIGQSASPESVLMSAAHDAKRPKPATTGYEVLQRTNGRTLIKAWPLTGRVHQIRVHFATIGHPVVGDEFYTVGGDLKPQTTDRDRRHALHASALIFRHPVTKQFCEVQAEIPQDLKQLCE